MSSSDEGMSPTSKTGIFVLVMAVVLGLFFYLSSLDRPPHMPAGETHTLRINTQAKLIGVGKEEVDPRTGRPRELDMNVEYNEKDVEKRVNATCLQCHGVPSQDNTKHPCHARTGKCVATNHPPKLTCIKCHRQAHPGRDAKPGEKVVNLPLFEKVLIEGDTKGALPEQPKAIDATPEKQVVPSATPEAKAQPAKTDAASSAEAIKKDPSTTLVPSKATLKDIQLQKLPKKGGVVVEPVAPVTSTTPAPLELRKEQKKGEATMKGLQKAPVTSPTSNATGANKAK